MKRFIKEKIAVKCETKEELEDFLKRCKKENLKWGTGHSADGWKLPFERYPVYMTSGFNYNKKPVLEYSFSCDHIERKKWKIVTYKEYFNSENQTITITRYGNKVVAKYGNKVGVAKCNPEDEFNFETGAKLAFERLFGTGVKEVKRNAKEGEYIKIVNAQNTKDKYKNGDIIKVEKIGNVYGEHYVIKRGYWSIAPDEYVVLEGYKPEPQKEPFKPYLTKDHQNRGLIGEETNLTALFGETLFVGDVVEVFEEWSKKKTERYIVKSAEGFHVDCLEMSTINLKNGVCKDALVYGSTYQVRKIKSYRELQHYEHYLNTKAILKEDN